MANYSHGRQTSRSYVYGNTARNIDVVKELNEAPSFKTIEEQQGDKRREKRSGMNFVYVLFLVAAMIVTGYALISYVKIQSDITNLVENISHYEQTLNNLTLANDDEYSKMINAIDYDEIRTVAIEELGMVYASKDQIITYTRENSDYVRQLSDLSN